MPSKSTPPCTVPRAVWAPSHAALNSKLYIQGGQAQDLSYVGQFFALDLSTAWDVQCPVWEELPSGPINFYHSSTSVPPRSTVPSDTTENMAMGTILTFKAPVDSSSLINRYDIATRTWANSSVQVLVPRRYGIDAVTNPSSGLVYLLGGYNTWLLDKMAIYDPYSDSLASEPLSEEQGSEKAQVWGLDYYSAAWVSSLQRVIYIGGTSDTYPNKTKASIELYSPAEDKWISVETKGDVPQDTDGACLAIDEIGGQAILFGGSGQLHDSNQIFFLNLDPASDAIYTWKQGQLANQSRRSMACAAYGRFFVAWGGKVNNAVGNYQTPVVYDLSKSQWVGRYDPISGTSSS
ncbi:hypothetical protein BGZ58_009503 [Dissophora ornata]|nr:hypothetical protein BGZ58_009503 [Dissophora ornata]